MFMASDAAPQRTLADIIMERINEKDMGGIEAAEAEGQLYNLQYFGSSHSTNLSSSLRPTFTNGMLLKLAAYQWHTCSLR